MTRKEEIVDAAKKAAEEVYSYTFQGMDDLIGLFKAGAEWADEHPIHYDGQAMLYVLQKGVKQGKKEMLDRVCKWIEFGDFFIENYLINDVDGNPDFQHEEFISDFKKAMEE